MRIPVVNAYINPCSDSIEIIFEIQEVSLCWYPLTMAIMPSRHPMIRLCPAFPSIQPPMTEEILEYDGKYWTLSSQRLSYMRDKTRDDRYFILSLFAIAKEMERSGRYSPLEQIQLAVGIPPEHYGMLRDKFAQYFKRGIIKFAYKDKPYTVMIPAA